MVAPTKVISTIAIPSTHGGFTAGASITSVRSGMIWVCAQVGKDRAFWGVGLDAAGFTLADPRFLLVDNGGNVKAAVAAPASFVWEASWLPLYDGSVLILGSYAEDFGSIVPTIWRVTFDETTGSGTCVDTGYQLFGGSTTLGVSGSGDLSRLADKNGYIVLPGLDLLSTAGSGKLLVIDTGQVSGTFSVTQSAAWGLTSDYLYSGTQPLPDGRWYCYGASSFTLGTTIVTAQYYTPATDTWASAPNSPTTARFPQCLAHPRGAFIMGDADRSSGFYYFNPDTLAWSAITARPNNSVGYFALLPDGRIMASGSGEAGHKNESHIYNPAADTWTALPVYPASNATFTPARYPIYGSDGQFHCIEVHTSSPNAFFQMLTIRIGGCGVPPTASQSATQVSLIPHADPGVDGVHFGIDPVVGAYVSTPAVALDLTVTVVSETLHSLEG